MPGVAGALEQGAATTYEVAVQQLELCASGSSIDATGASAPSCLDPYVVGSGSATFDIASVAAGAALGNYSSISSLPAGKTYTHIRITLARRFSIAGTLASGCRTDSADTSSSITTPGIGIHDSGTGTPQTLYIPNVDAFGPGIPSDADYWSNGVQIIDGSTFSLVHSLEGSVTGGGTLPKITVAFNTQTALSGQLNGQVCDMFPAAPSANLGIE